MLLAEARDQLIPTELVMQQAAAMFLACRQKLLLIPHTLARRLVGKDRRAIHEALTTEIDKALRQMATLFELGSLVAPRGRGPGCSKLDWPP